MTDETGIKLENAQDGDKVAKDETRTDTETKEPKETKQRSVSFNRDVHVKRFGKPRESRGTSSEHQQPSVRKEPFTHLSEQELIDEANKVLAQAESVTCTADHPPDKFFSLPHRRKFKDDKLGRRNSDDAGTPESKGKSPLGRSTSDVTARKRRERTSLSTLFRRAQRNKSPDSPVVVTTKPVAVVKRSKSDVSDLKSNTNLNSQPKPIRKRSGSETEEFLKSLRNKKAQLSPIIESSPREDYFRKTPPLEVFHKEKLSQKDSNKAEQQNIISNIKRVNPVEKPPRYKTPEKQDPKPPTRTKRGKSSEKDKEKSPSITETPKRKTDIKKTLLVDEIDCGKSKDNNSVEIKDRIKDSIRKIEENVYGEKDMVHSSQQPPAKPPLTRGHTVDHLVRILKEDQNSPPPKSHLISPPNGTNVNQPFSYLKPSISPDPKLFVRNTSPDRIPTPVNKMTDKGVVYAQVVRDHGDTASSTLGKQTVHKTYSPSREKYGNLSDEDEGLGHEEKHKFSDPNRMFDYDYKANEHEHFNSMDGYKITDSPIRPHYREYKPMRFEDLEPTYANEYPSKEDRSRDLIDKFRGRADGMDTKRKQYETENKTDLHFNELSHRRQLLESRLNARRYDRERINPEEPISRYLAEIDPIYEAEKRMKATEKYVNETAKYYRHTLEKDGFAESTVTEDYNKYDSDNHKVKYNTETRTFHKVPKGELDRREYIDTLSVDPRYKEDKKVFPPEPEYEPPSLEFNAGKHVLSPDEYKEKKYKAKKHIISSQDVIQTGQKYKVKDDWFGKRKGHYASNPEIAQEREEDYVNLRYDSYHNSLRRTKNKDMYYKEEPTIRRHDSGDSRDYYRGDRSPRRFDFDSRLVDSGIENDFRKDSSGEIHRRHRRHESDDDVRNTSLFLASERRHTEDNYPNEQIYANGEYLARFEDIRNNGYRKEYVPRERSADDGSHFDPKLERYDKSPSRHNEKTSAKPPKATKKLSGLEKMKQLFSRDSSKKSKKEKETVQPKTRTRVLKSPEHLAQDDSEYRRYTDPEPSDIDVRKKDYDTKDDEKRYRSSREDLDRYKSSREDLDRRICPREEDNKRVSPKDELDRHRSPKDDFDRPRYPREDLNLDRHRNLREDFDRHKNPREELDRHRTLREDFDRNKTPRDNFERHKSSREELDRLKSPREDFERHKNSREDLDRHRSPRIDFDKYRNSREDLDRHRNSGEELDKHRSSREDLERHRNSREDLDRYRNSRDDLDRYRNSDHRDSDLDRKYRSDFDGRYERTIKEERRYKELKEEKRRYNSSDRESDRQSRPSDAESDRRKTRSRTAGPLDSPALAERYRERRRLATPSPTPSPPPRQPAPAPQTSAGNWFKSLDRLGRKRGKSAGKVHKIEKDSVITTEDESTRKTWTQTKSAKPLPNSPAKNLRFFGDTDQDSDVNIKRSTVAKSKSHPNSKPHGTLRKTISNSSTGLDEVDHSELSNKSYSLSNLYREDKSESPRTKQYYKRNLHNITEIQSNSETESQFDRKVNMKPPISPYERRSRSHSSSKTLKASKSDMKRAGRVDVRSDDRGSSSELRSSKQELSRDLKHRRQTPVTNSGESSTEGDSSHQSQRSVVYLHATTVGDIPDPGRLTRNRSRDDVSSVNSSNLQVRNTTKSFSIFAPWTPKHYSEHQDVHYAQRPRKTKTKESAFKKSSSTKNLAEDRPATLQKNKSYSQTTLTRRPQSSRLSSSNTTLYRKPEKRKEAAQNTTMLRKPGTRDKKSQSSEVINRDSDRERVSRSISMPKDNNKKAGWFKLSNKNKKQEINTRVR